MAKNDNQGGYSLDYVPVTNRAHYHRARITLIQSGTEQKCSKCESEERIEAHHVDQNIKNCDISNLVWLCRKCHEELHGLSRNEKT